MAKHLGWRRKKVKVGASAAGKEKARRGRRSAGLSILTNNREEEVLLVPSEALGGGVRLSMI
jgi:hypothetical protein